MLARGLLIVSFITLHTLAYSQPSNLAESQKVVEYAIIVTGGELLNGTYPDQHTNFITNVLTPKGFQCVLSLIVGDTPEDLERALRFAGNRVRLIIVTGGLGPTKDDITRETLSSYSGIALEQSPEVLEELKQRYPPSLLARQNVIRQTKVPVKGRFMKNLSGTAVGLIFDDEDQVLVALPGPPRELRPMVMNEMIPFLVERFAIKKSGASLTMRFVGIGESAIDEVIDNDIQLPDGIRISSLFESGRVDLTFSLAGETDTAMKILRELETKLLEKIGEFMYSDDYSSLEEKVVTLLRNKGIRLGTAEVSTAGQITSSLLKLKGTEDIFSGGFVAGSSRQLMEILAMDSSSLDEDSGPAEFSRAVAESVIQKTGSNWVLTTSQLKKVNQGNSSFWISIHSQNRLLASKEIILTSDAQPDFGYLLTQSLDLLRRTLNSSK